MINFDDAIKEKIKEHNLNWPQIPDNPYRILIIGGTLPGKTNSLFNLINQQPDIDQIYLYGKDLYKAKHQFLINKRESAGLKHFNPNKSGLIEGRFSVVGVNLPPSPFIFEE